MASACLPTRQNPGGNCLNRLKPALALLLLAPLTASLLFRIAANNATAADLAALDEAAGAAVHVLPPVTDSDGRWGLNHTYSIQQLHELTRDAGASWNRWEVRWGDIEPTQHDFHYGTVDGMVSESLRNSLSIEAILISMPDWATDPQTQLPKGLYLPWDSPQNLWGAWVKQTVARYKNRIKYFEAWNEPDNSDTFWPGTTADYYQLLKVTYQAVKSVDPSNQVLMGGLSYWSNQSFLDDLLALMMADPTAPAHNYYFDILPWHQYSRPSDLYDRITQSRQKLSQTIGPKPIWVNEANVSAWDESAVHNDQPYPFSATMQEQASYQIQAAAYAIAAGADKIFIYRLQDTDWPEAFGLLRLDRTLRPAYVAYQVATHNLSFIDSATLLHLQNVEEVAMRRAADRITVLWNRTPNRLVASIGARALTATLVDQTGATSTVRASGGAYQIDLSPATDNNGDDANDYIIGGLPFIMLESPGSQQVAEETDAMLGFSGVWNLVTIPGASGGSVRRTASAGLGMAVDFGGA